MTNLSGLMSHREMRNVISSTTNVVHLLVSDVGTLACGDPLGVGNVSFRKVTTDPETATCMRCKVGWLEYQRDQYKEMFERNEALLLEEKRKYSALRDEYIILQHQRDELNRNAQGGH